VLALAGILTYIALRFQFSFAVGAVAATLHDLLVCLAFLAFFRYDITLNVIAGLLTITGYSVNDTIVIFDRVRENMRAMRRDNLTHIVNVAVNQTLARTVITAGTTLLSVIALYLFGGEVLEGFAFTMLVGIISGTYSTVFIAAAIAILWQGRRPVKGQAAPAAAAPARKPGRRRAS
jgi:preprotein translocase subunit SecF